VFLFNFYEIATQPKMREGNGKKASRQELFAREVVNTFTTNSSACTIRPLGGVLLGATVNVAYAQRMHLI